MSYPGRPPLVQGLSMATGMAYMSMTGPPPPLMQAVMPLQHVTTAPQIRAFPKLNPHREQLKQMQGPPVTVFVGNITEKAPDTMIRQILATCGPVISWKRVKGFGFCELAGPDAGLRAVRILHDLMVGEKRLVAKVDAKTKAVLDEYKAEKRKKEKGSGSPLQDEPEEEEPLDEETQALDSAALERIQQLLVEYKDEMNNFELKKEEEVLEKRNKILDEADVEEEKRDLITREIGKFREIMKKQEEEREVHRKKDKDKDRERKDRSTTHSPSPRRREKDEKKRRRTRSRSRDRSERDRNERDRSRDRELRERERERERELRERERERERDREMRDRERDRDRERERERDRDDKSKSTKDLLKEKEMEEESKEKKKAERRAREKEASYQERLRGWEARERRKAKEYEKEREKERIREEEHERDAKRLKEFLEDYDDERDDVKYYKGRELQKRLAERVKEAESDARDRAKEKEEIEELKNKVFSGEYEDPNAEFERLKKEREEQYKPKLLIDVNLEHWKQREKEKERELERQKQRERDRDREQERERDRQRQREEREKYVVQQAAQELAAVEAEPIDSDSDMDNDHFSPPPPAHDNSDDGNTETAQWTQVQVGDEDSRHSLTSNHEEEAPPPHPTMKMTLSKPIVFSPHGQSRDPKRKKADLREIFNPDEDDTTTQVKKRKLVPLDYNEDKKSSKKDKENGEKKSDESLKSQEEKRKHIKSLIEKIPTEKDALFAYQLDWSAIDNGLMEKKIRPWINKKIIEYIGEPEPTLVDFICSKVMAGSQPQVILEDVQMVLDEEAEVFVVKMWRLLIYEVEAKKLGLVK